MKTISRIRGQGPGRRARRCLQRAPQEPRGHATRVVDGDTLRLTPRDGSGRMKSRMNAHETLLLRAAGRKPASTRVVESGMLLARVCIPDARRMGMEGGGGRWTRKKSS